MLTHSEAILHWQRLTAVEQAKVRHFLIRELAWLDSTEQPAWHWRKQHAALLDFKRATARPRQDKADGPA